MRQAWRIAKTISRFAVRIVITILNSLSFGLLDLLLGFLVWPQKQLRLQVIILSTKEAPVNEMKALEPPPEEIEQLIHNAIERSQKFYIKFFNINIIPYQKAFIENDDALSPKEAFHFHCSICSEFGIAGEYFAKLLAGWHIIPLSLTFPITVYVINSFMDNSIGCSMSVLSDYIVINRQGLLKPLTLAHEIGHACGLWHSRNHTNFMHRISPTTEGSATWSQKNLLRSSRHVQYW